MQPVCKYIERKDVRMEDYILLLLCGIGAVRDIRTHTVCTGMWGTAALAGAVWNMVWKERDGSWVIISALVGLTLIILSQLMKGRIGLGDGIVFLTLGLWKGAGEAGTILFYSLLLCSLWSILQLIQKKMKRSDSVPFLPFIFFGIILNIII